MNPHLHQQRLKPYLIVMLKVEGQQMGLCLSAKRTVPFSRVLPVSLEFQAVKEYAASVGAETCFYSERRPIDSEFICSVNTYRSGRKNGWGRMASTFHTWVIFKRKPISSREDT